MTPFLDLDAVLNELVETLGITRLSKSQVSVMAKELDAHVEDFRTRPLDQGLDVLADPASPFSPPTRPPPQRRTRHPQHSPPKVLPPDHVVTPSSTTTLDLTTPRRRGVRHEVSNPGRAKKWSSHRPRCPEAPTITCWPSHWPWVSLRP